jgi:gas vesicle protein
MCERAQAEDAETERGCAFGWFVTGALVGAALGILYAPRSGSDTREAIGGKSRELYGRTREMYARGRELVDDAAELFERGRRLATRDAG